MRNNQISPRAVVVPSAITNVIARIHFMVAYAVAAGWPPEKAFEASMMLMAHGVTLTEAKLMFEACERALQ